VNLASAVLDGEQLYIPRVGERVATAMPAGVSQPNGRVPTNASPNGSLTGGAATSGASTTASTLPLIIDLNRATAQDLDKLPGVGPATAKAIIDHRTRNGPFASVDDLLKVKGIGPAKLAEIRPWVST
jgi:competence protein ComEA